MRKRTFAALAAVGLLFAAGAWSSGVTAASATGGGHGHTPVTICHNGHTITVDDSAVKAHLKHGDTLGACPTPEPTPEPTGTPEPTTPPTTETPEPTTPPVTETPEPEPTTTPTEPAPVIEPQIQDYVTCKGGAFVLDNTSSTVDVVYVINGVSFTAPAGQAVHTDADGTLIQPTSDLGGYLVTAGERSWTFPAAGDCGTTIPVTPIPVTGHPVLSITPANCVPKPDEGVKVVRWDIPDGLAIGGVTGKGEAADEAADILRAAISGDGGMMRPRSWVLPITVLDGFTYDGPLTVTLAQTTDAPNGNLASCPTPTTPPTGEPTTPAPSDGPTTPAPGTPSPTAGTTPPASSPVARTSSPKSTASVAPVVDDTSGGTDRLAYTGMTDGTITAAWLAGALVLFGGGGLLIARTVRRRREIRDGQ